MQNTVGGAFLAPLPAPFRVKDTGLQNQELKESTACLLCTKVSEYDIMRGWVSFTENFYCAIITDKIK